MTLTWALLAGQVAVLELRYKSFADPTNATATEIEVSDWMVLRTLTPEETKVAVKHEFNLDLSNSFALLTFEDEEVQRVGIRNRAQFGY